MSQPGATPDLSTPDGLAQAMKIIRREEYQRWTELMHSFIHHMPKGELRDSLQGALDHMEIVNAE